METPVERAQAECAQLERELKRCPDFQLYLLTESHRDRARMESVLMEIPQFALWRTLMRAVKYASHQSLASMMANRDEARLAPDTGSHHNRSPAG
jgi:hypothetical protein